MLYKNVLHSLVIYLLVLACRTYSLEPKSLEDAEDLVRLEDTLEDSDLMDKRRIDRFHMGIGKRDALYDSDLEDDYEKRRVDPFAFSGTIGKRRIDRFNFNGGIGKRLDRFGFSGGIGKRPWDNYDLIGNNKRRVDRFSFAGGIGKRRIDGFNFAGGIGKRRVDRFSFAGGIGKRRIDGFNFAGGIGKRRVDRFSFAGGIGKRDPDRAEDSVGEYEKFGEIVNDVEKRSVPSGESHKEASKST